MMQTLALFFLLSSSLSQSWSEFSAFLSPHLALVVELEPLFEEKNSFQFQRHPKKLGFYPLLKFSHFNPSGELEFFCLTLHATEKENLLQVSHSKKEKRCTLVAKKDLLFTLMGFDHLELFLTKNTLTINHTDFQLPNLGLKRPHKIYHSSAHQGLHFIAIHSSKSASLPPQDFIDLEGSDGVFCHQLNDNCEEIMPNQCEKTCLHGWHEVVGNGCSTARNKICGQENCGAVKEIACFRGLEHSGFIIHEQCVKDSLAAFCVDGATPTCVGKQNEQMLRCF